MPATIIAHKGKIMKTYLISGMHCQQCIDKVQKALQSLPGVISLHVSIGRADIESSQNIADEQINAALLQAGAYTLKNARFDFSHIKTYIPLIAAFSSVVLWTLARGALLGWNVDEAMYDFMGAFFLVFGMLKVVSWPSFATNFHGYDPLAAKCKAYAYLYPLIELFLGVAYQFRLPLQPLYNVITIAILGCTTVGVLQALSKKQKIQCACLGGYFNIPITWFTVFENILMIAMALLFLYEAK